MSSFVDSLWILDNIGNEINACLNMLYGQVTQRNGSGEGLPQYFIHIGATAQYETKRTRASLLATEPPEEPVLQKPDTARRLVF